MTSLILVDTRTLISQPAGLLLALMLAAATVPVTATGVQQAQPRVSILKRLGYFLQSENREVRIEFAAIALEKMIAAYEVELEQLNSPGKSSFKEMRKRRRWATAVNQYLDYLYAFDEVIKQAPLVEIIADQPGPVQLLSGEFLLPIASPRIAKPEQLENDITQAFCDAYSCDAQALEDPVEQAQPPVPRSGWSFRAGLGPTYQTLDGLSFMFSNVHQKVVKEQVCLRISKQLHQLGDALARAIQRGHAVDWHYLKLLPGAKSDDQQILLSARTPALRMALPDLALAEDVLAIAKPWLKARLENKSIEQFFPGADRLFAKLIQVRN